MSHDLLEPISFDVLDAVSLVDLVHRDALVLQSEEKVDQFANLVGIIALVLVSLLQLPVFHRYLHH